MPFWTTRTIGMTFASLLNHLESYGEDDDNPYVLAAGTKLGVPCNRRATPFAMVQ